MELAKKKKLDSNFWNEKFILLECLDICFLSLKKKNKFANSDSNILEEIKREIYFSRQEYIFCDSLL